MVDIAPVLGEPTAPTGRLRRMSEEELDMTCTTLYRRAAKAGEYGSVTISAALARQILAHLIATRRG